MTPFFYSFYGGTKKAKRLGVLILQAIQKHKRGLSIVFGAIFSFNAKINRRENHFDVAGTKPDFISKRDMRS